MASAGPSTARNNKPRILFTTIALLTTFTFLALLLITLVFPGHLPERFVATHGASKGSDIRLSPEKHALRNASTWHYHWRITTGLRRPDGVLRRVYLINNAFPGPTIQARSGDRLVISIENALCDGETTSIHWHGLSMRLNSMDGVAGVTQAPIEAGDTFVYDFEVDISQHGTFWYHSHDALQRADGLYGGLVVHAPIATGSPDAMDDEHLLLIGDWYHRSAQEALDFYTHPGAFGLETVPDSLLVNGVGSYNCSQAVAARPVDCKERAIPKALTLNSLIGRRTVIRLVNVGACAAFDVSFSGATLTTLRVDGGHEVKASPARTVGYLHPGERIDLLVEVEFETSHDSVRLRIAMDEKPFKYENTALTTVHEFLSDGTSDVAWRTNASGPILEHCDIEDLKPATDQSTLLPTKADRTIVLCTITQKLARLKNEPHGFINHSTWPSVSNDPLVDKDGDESSWRGLVLHIAHDPDSPLWVDIVLNNLDEDAHPFHLHGHDFWILSRYTSNTNWGSYNPWEEAQASGGRYDLADALRKDTVYVPKRGYVVLRFRADNTGLWMFHCHVLWHQASGMAMAFDIGE